MERPFEQQRRIDRARRRVKRMKSFYIHLMVFIVIATFSVVKHYLRLTPQEDFFQWKSFIGLMLWGVVVIIHGISVFMPHLIFSAQWEDRKIKEYLDKEHPQKWN